MWRITYSECIYSRFRTFFTFIYVLYFRYTIIWFFVKVINFFYCYYRQILTVTIYLT